MTVPRALTLIALASLLGCRTAQRRPDGSEGPLPVGAPAPEVVGFDAADHEVRLSALRGHPAVVYFYPRDGTPGCTKEACAFRDVWKKFEAAHVAIIGVSLNTAERHAEFLHDKQLPFALASDESGTVANAYGVAKGLFGEERVTFLVDSDGKIARYWGNVDPGIHAAEVLAAASALP